ncbi:histidinol dehydrogenase [Salibaculum griseiflavum]|uniref:Histidinol dehydrogenase homolog n=1 Tax=Salibaculum griseiflavum TaxID=1914409 RepID=A0A2V1P2N2_9RHOB|nr:histidinol dehydrogenase [Salibaculum griseiflavum]PWG16789.1 histidinol dehydrogenase [Salibaculum griseiflavum]
MAEYLKVATPPAAAGHGDVRAQVAALLAEIDLGGEASVRDLAARFDGWEGPLIVPRQDIDRAAAALSDAVKEDIRFAHHNIRRFAQAQRDTMQDTQVEILPGVIAGQRQIPIAAAGCYVPGGRYAHVASAIMTITTAKVAGVGHVTACSPPRPGGGIAPEVLFAMDLCGADAILTMGGVQAIAAMARGYFGLPAVDILVGPGNQYVAEAKRVLFGEVGIDMVAGPTDVLVLADSTADPEIVAWDLVGQAEHGHNSPVWLVTSDRKLAETVIARVPLLIETLPQINRDSARAAWADHAEVVLCETREEMAQVSDRYAAEHLHVQCDDLDWWLGRLRNYGSLFLGEETTVAFGDKASGPNHVLPTSGAARYTGGLSVAKFMKTVTWQRATRDGIRPLAEATARISRLEGMEGHARTADIRIAKFFPDAPAG